jgi:DNA-binding NarL/FixJ family response regulator
LKCLEDYEGAAFVLAGSGAIVYANRVALSSYPQPPGWLAACAAGNRSAVPSWVRKLPLQADGSTFWLLLPDRVTTNSDTAHEEHWVKCWDLPRRFAQVAALIMQGLTDKEIAVHLGLKLSTVRTYVKELLARAGVHSRARLVVAALRLG